MGSFSVFPALAGVILVKPFSQKSSKSFSRTRGGDPKCIQDISFGISVFPALAGVIPGRLDGLALDESFSRTRGGDPQSQL